MRVLNHTYKSVEIIVAICCRAVVLGVSRWSKQKVERAGMSGFTLFKVRPV